ncbi:MAG: UPF0236 family protein [Bacilli bacterium]|nr:UPF0236 family protein [Bacilli bacterium]
MISQNSRNLNRERGNNQLAELIHKCKENAKEHAREYLIKFFRTIDDQFFNSRLWENEFKNHGFIGRTWITSIGVIKFKRRYYVSMDKKRNKNLYFVDAYFQLPKYTRLTPDAMLALTRMATDTNASYAAKHALWDAKISKQTVSNLLRSFTPVYEDLPVLPEIIEDFNESKETIYIELDEAHCNLQNSKNIIANLGLVHTGHKTSNYASKRKELENKHYFGGVNVDTSSFSDRIYDYISKRYNNGGVKYIFVSGDGAAWIKSVHNKLKRCFSNNNIEVVQVLDRFHLRKRLTTIFSGNKKMINYFLNNVDKMTAEGFTKIAYTFYEGNPDCR